MPGRSPTESVLTRPTSKQEHFLVGRDSQQARRFVLIAHLVCDATDVLVIRGQFHAEDASLPVVDQQAGAGWLAPLCGNFDQLGPFRADVTFEQVELVFQVGDALLVFLDARPVLQSDVLCQQFLVALSQLTQATGDQAQERQRQFWSFFGLFDPFVNFVVEGHTGVPRNFRLYQTGCKLPAVRPK